MTDAEKLAKIQAWIAKRYEKDFDFDQEHWVMGNFDDSYQYGFDSGEQSTLGAIKVIIEEIEG